MRTKSIIIIGLLVLLAGIVSCNKDHDIPTGIVFTNNGHGYVDLGLPSGTLWATCNLGANSPEDYGNYYAWGETTTKSTYDWSTYKYCDGDYNQLTKYCSNSAYGYNSFTDNLTVLQASDDAATANLGSGWCMPCTAQWEELNDNTTVTWTLQNGVSGRKFTASNGNSLFLPAAGYCIRGSLINAGSYGNYWSSSLHTDHTDGAWILDFNSSKCNVSGDGRSYGLSVRPVHSGIIINLCFVTDVFFNQQMKQNESWETR